MNTEWIPASKPPPDASRVIAKNQHNDISEAFYFNPKQWSKPLQKKQVVFMFHVEVMRSFGHTSHITSIGHQIKTLTRSL